MKTLTSSLALCAVLISSGAAQAALIDRGGGLIYDTDLNVTWLQDANLADSNSFGVSGILINGAMSWSTAQSWIAAMRDSNYLGYNDWRLPTVTDTGTPGCDFAYSGTDCGYYVNTATSKMAHLFYDELLITPYFNTSGVGPQAGWGTLNAGPFIHLQGDSYWSSTEYLPGNNNNLAWAFGFGGGLQYVSGTASVMFALAVRPGDVAAVPVPAAAWLLGSGLLGLIGVARRKAV